MRKNQITRLKRPEQKVEKQILHLSLQGLLPEDQLLVVNQQTRTLSLLSPELKNTSTASMLFVFAL